MEPTRKFAALESQLNTTKSEVNNAKDELEAAKNDAKDFMDSC